MVDLKKKSKIQKYFALLFYVQSLIVSINASFTSLTLSEQSERFIGSKTFLAGQLLAAQSG